MIAALRIPQHKPLPARLQAEIERARLAVAAEEIVRLEGFTAALAALDGVRRSLADNNRDEAARLGWIA